VSKENDFRLRSKEGEDPFKKMMAGRAKNISRFGKIRMKYIMIDGVNFNDAFLTSCT